MKKYLNGIFMENGMTDPWQSKMFTLMEEELNALKLFIICCLLTKTRLFISLIICVI